MTTAPVGRLQASQHALVYAPHKPLVAGS